MWTFPVVDLALLTFLWSAKGFITRDNVRSCPVCWYLLVCALGSLHFETYELFMCTSGQKRQKDPFVTRTAELCGEGNLE